MSKLNSRSLRRNAFFSLWLGLFIALPIGRAAGLPDASRSGGCTHDIECDDGMPCTVDRCNFPFSGPVGAGVCMHDPVPDGQPGGVGGPDCAPNYGLLCGGCDDGAFCNGAETCQAGACAPGTPPCIGGQVCSESLNLCQAGPCSAQKTCMGGPTPGATCTGNNGCGNGGLCRFADCEDGLLCNGEETCVAGVCQPGENPCGHGALCSDRQCSQGASIDICITDEDCLPRAGSTIGGTCSLIGPVCFAGRCCSNSSEPACSRRLPKGICTGNTAGTNAAATCSSNADCHSNSCAALAGSCSVLGGHFYAGDVSWGNIPSGGSIICPIVNDIPTMCPKYGGGIAPFGNVVQYVGSVSYSDRINPLAGMPMKKLGDDYSFTNTGVCVGGGRNGLGCADNSACPGGGICDLAGPSVMSVYYLRMIGGIFPDTQIVVEFRDAVGRFVAESNATRDSVSGLERFFLDPPLIVPIEGFVVLRVASEYTPNGGFVWAGTDAVDIGFNDPDLLWVNDGPVSNFLAPSPGILAFELEGEKVAAPLGACCDSAGVACSDGVLPWVCEGEENHFQGAGTTCPAPACDTGACCHPNSGECTVGTETDCANASGDFQGYGTECDADHSYDSGQQHCCPQPAGMFSGADKCQDVIIHVVTAPPLGETRVLTITGDNSAATLQPGETPCYAGSEAASQDLGWHEGFETIECTMIRVDYCCTDPVKHPAYHALFDECPCSNPIFSSENPYQFYQPDHAAGAPYCDDENEWATFGPLSPGHYYIPVHSALPGSFGPYQIHITAEACPTAACCVADQCTDDVNQLECDALGGVFLAPPNRSPAVIACTGSNGQAGSTCFEGSCCSGPGDCFDVMLGQPLHKSDCDSQGGSFTGGVRCQGGTCQASPVESCAVNADCPGNDNCIGTPQQLIAPSPCPICSIEEDSNCQTFDDTLNFTLSDRHLGVDGMLAADDFRPSGGVLDRLCVWGFYLDGDPDAFQADCGPAVAFDSFRVRVFNNDPATGRSPGTLLGESTASSQKGIISPSVVQVRLLVEQYGYQLVLDTPIAGMTPGAIYWLEVSNDVSDSLATCAWFWNQRAQTSSSYSFNGNENGYPTANAAQFENVFCLNFAFPPSTIGGLDGACCRCDGSCSLKTLVECANDNGVWDIMSTTCTGVVCPIGPPANDNCIDGPPTITEGTYTVSNQCASTDGFGPSNSDFGATLIDFDLWYYFIAPLCCGDLVVGECRTGLQFDTALAVYNNCPGGIAGGCDPTVCPPCPLDAVTTAAHQAGAIQDESCVGVVVGGSGVWRSSEQILRNPLPGECFLIRVGGFPGSRGTAILDVSCEPPNVVVDCFPITLTRFVELDRCILFDLCESPNPSVGAIRVHLTSLHHVNPPYTGGPSIPFSSFEGQVRWAGPPSQYVESSANPTPFWVSRLQCTPHYQDWGGMDAIYVTGSEIVPSSSYDYELVRPSCSGSEDSCTDVSRSASAYTTRWGDIEFPFSPPSATAQPDVGDISALVDKFKNAPGAPIKVRALLAGVDQFGNMNIAPDLDFSHIAACVDAFRGRPYPYAVSSCP